MYRGIIFDFDGVIAESIKLKSDAFAELYSTFGNNIVQKVVEHHESNGGMSRYEKIKYYHETFLQQVISHKEISELAYKFSDLVVDKVISAPYVPGVLDYIQKCNNKYKLFISTGTPTKEIKKILIGRNILHYFNDVFGSPNGKTSHIKSIISRFDIKHNELLFYGDSNEDLKAARKTDVTFTLVKNKFNKILSDKYRGNSINNFLELL